MAKPQFQHRHYVMLAAIIAAMPDNFGNRELIADYFAYALVGTNSGYSVERFFAAAIGAPQTRKDAAR